MLLKTIKWFKMEQMVQEVERIEYSPIKIHDSVDIHEIREALEATLFLPDGQLKSQYIETHLDYLRSKFSIASIHEISS